MAHSESSGVAGLVCEKDSRCGWPLGLISLLRGSHARVEGGVRCDANGRNGVARRSGATDADALRGERRAATGAATGAIG